MLEAKELSDFLSTYQEQEKYQDYNDDYDLGDVLEFCNIDEDDEYKVRYDDGKEHILSFSQFS